MSQDIKQHFEFRFKSGRLTECPFPELALISPPPPGFDRHDFTAILAPLRAVWLSLCLSVRSFLRPEGDAGAMESGSTSG